MILLKNITKGLYFKKQGDAVRYRQVSHVSNVLD